MNVLSLRAENVARFEHVDLTFQEGATALVGPNGSGKSTLLNLVELALFAEGSRDLAPLLSPWADRLEIELGFEHAGRLYKVRRGYKQGSGGRGTATLDLEVLDETVLESHPLTREDTKATQAELCRILGLSRDTFNASSFLGQGNASAFPDATPADRKALLGAILDPHALWPRLAEMARTESKAAETALATDSARILEREAVVAQLPQMEAIREQSSRVQFDATTDVMAAEETLEQAQAAVQANAAAAERHRAATDAVSAAQANRDRAATDLKGAQAQAEKLEPARKQLAELEFMAARVPELERIVEETRQAKHARELALQKVAEAQSAVGQQEERVDHLARERASLQQAFDAATAKSLAISTAEEAHCDRCEQILGGQAKAVALESLRLELNGTYSEISARDKTLGKEHDRLTELTKAVTAISVPIVPPRRTALPVDSESELRDCRQAAEQRGTVATLIAGYEEHALAVDALYANRQEAAAVLLQRTEELAQAAEGMKDPEVLEDTVAEARMMVTARRATLDEAKVAVIRVEEQLARVRQAESELAVLRAATLARQTELDLLKLAERAYGRDGIPVLLVESVIPQIEAEANRILEQMPTSDGVVFTVELRTQRALKTDADKVRETLDILVSDPDGERAYETFSGGERARLNIALRIALARLLAHRRGAESRLLAIDELEYLDLQGQEHLVDVVKGVAADFDKVIIVSHSPNVRDSFDHTIEIEKRDGVSRVVGDREQVAA